MSKRPVIFADNQWVAEFITPSRILGFALGAVLIITVGPFGTFEKPLLWRIEYWLSWFAIVWVATTIMFALCQRVATRIDLATWKASLLSLGFSIPMAAFSGLSLATVYFSSVKLNVPMLLAEGKFLSPIVVGVTCLLHMTIPQRANDKDDSEQNGPPISPFFERLPKELGQDLISISVSDHYLHVQTSLGDTLIHGSLSEAVDQLGDFQGCQIHRSHWVALNAIENRKWTDHRLQLVLSNGSVLPVSRSYRPQLLEQL